MSEQQVQNEEITGARSGNPSNWWIIVFLGGVYFLLLSLTVVLRIESLFTILIEPFFRIGIVGIIILFGFRFLVIPIAIYLDGTAIQNDVAAQWEPWRTGWVIGVLLSPFFAGSYYLFRRHKYIGTP